MALTESLLKDDALVDSIIQSYESEPGIPESPNVSVSADDVRMFLHLARTKGINSARASFSERGMDSFRVEAVILKQGRPTILIEDNTFKSSSDEWGSRLEAVRNKLEGIIPAVGRIDMSNPSGGFTQIGTGWLVASNVIVTNSHVAKKFGEKDSNGKLVFKKDQLFFNPFSANIDFLKEHGIRKTSESKVVEILYFEQDENPDIAFLKISSNAADRGTATAHQGKPISLSSTPVSSKTPVAVIGYPDKDFENNPLSFEEAKIIFNNIYGVKRLQPGEIMAVRSDLLTHDCSTTGGNSGSVLVSLETGEAVGLHYGGDFLSENRAVPAQVIKKLLSELKL